MVEELREIILSLSDEANNHQAIGGESRVSERWSKEDDKDGDKEGVSGL